MLALLTWLAGTVGLGYLINHWHLWRPGLAAMADLAFLAWLIGGAALLARGFVPRGYPDKKSVEWARSVHEAAAKEEAARRVRENVAK